MMASSGASCIVDVHLYKYTYRQDTHADKKTAPFWFIVALRGKKAF